MKCLTNTETTQLLDSWSTRAQHDSRDCSTSIKIPIDAGVRTSLIRNLMELFASGQQMCVHATAWGIWPSNQNMPLFYLVRTGLGEDRPIHEAPGHVFGPTEHDAAEALCCLFIYFLWDATVVGENGELRLRLSHDEFIDVDCTERLQPEVDRIRAVFEGN